MFLAASIIATIAFCSPSLAHGRMFADPELCRLSIGPDIMSFAAYQPESSGREFCETLPSVGRTVFVFDGEQPELREMSTEIRIVKDGGQNGDDDLTVAYRKPELYPTGSIEFEHTFRELGYYASIVTATARNGAQWTARFPFSVGKSFVREAPYYLPLAAAGIAGPFVYLTLLKDSR